MAYEGWLAEVAPPFEAGNTMLLYVLPQNPAIEGIDIPVLVTALTAAVEDGRIDEELIDANARRVLELRRTLALADATSVNNE
jgi:beta-glucosidase-like glycosyl hydrolase